MKLFLLLLNMSISAGWVILLLLLLRPFIKKAPRWVNVLLWGIAAIRLVLPFGIKSNISLMPSTQTVSPDILYDAAPKIHSGIYAVNTLVNPIITESFAPTPGDSINPLQVYTAVASFIWIIGIAALLIYGIMSYYLLYRRIRFAVMAEKRVYESASVPSPFILGIIRPRIYLPSGLDEAARQFVLAHERAHIKRGDHLIKPFGYLLLTLYWFSPLVWIAYILLCRDIEEACDQKVIKELGDEAKTAYSETLLSLSSRNKTVSACPLAFGETNVKKRIESVLNYKRPAFWIIIASVLLSAAVTVFFLTDPLDKKEEEIKLIYPLSYVGIDAGSPPTYHELAATYNTYAEAFIFKSKNAISLDGFGFTITDDGSFYVTDPQKRIVAGKLGSPLATEELPYSIPKNALWKEGYDRESLKGNTAFTYPITLSDGSIMYLLLFYNRSIAITDGAEYCINLLRSYHTEQLQGDHVATTLVYMNPLSSNLNQNANTYLRFYGTRLEEIDPITGSVSKTIESFEGEWQPFTTELNKASFTFSEYGGYLPEFKSIIMARKLTHGRWLLTNGTVLMYGIGSPDNKVGFWTVYVIEPVKDGGCISFINAPDSSSHYPGLMFEFNADYDELYMKAEGGKLYIPGTQQSPSDTLMSGKTTYVSAWMPDLPQAEKTLPHTEGRVYFELRKNGKVLYCGNLEFTRTEESENGTKYAAKLLPGSKMMIKQVSNIRNSAIITPVFTD